MAHVRLFDARWIFQLSLLVTMISLIRTVVLCQALSVAASKKFSDAENLRHHPKSAQTNFPEAIKLQAAAHRDNQE